MNLPEEFLRSLEGLPGYDREAFLAVHLRAESISSVRLNPAKLQEPHWKIPLSPVPWSKWAYYLATRPSFTFDPYFHAGAYYVQEASSMLLEQVLLQHADLGKPVRVLDLCSAPGGKSTHLHSLISSDSLLVSNEVIRSRATVLRDNIIKWGTENVAVLNNDPADFGRMGGFFDMMVVDAPCSGSGLFRRDAAAINEWSSSQVDFCALRQKRILADSWPALKEDGLLIYSTCSYSQEEDEEILKWLMQELDPIPLSLNMAAAWGVVEVNANGAWGYRSWPHRVKGEGFFIAAFRKKKGGTGFALKNKSKAERISKQEKHLLKEWVNTDNKEWVKNGNTVFAWPPALAPELEWMLENMNMLYAGVRVGELMRNKMVPDHALAQSGMLHEAIPVTNLDPDQAIAYLQRKEFAWPGKGKGWQIAAFEGQKLGWVNVLSNRINNYYPKELRILKEK